MVWWSSVNRVDVTSSFFDITIFLVLSKNSAAENKVHLTVLEHELSRDSDLGDRRGSAAGGTAVSH